MPALTATVLAILITFDIFLTKVVVKPLSEAPSNAVGIEVEVEVEVENNEENNETPSPKIHISKQINGVTNTTTINTAAFINFEKNNPFVQKLVDRFVQEYNGELWGHNGPGLLTRTWQDYDQNTNDLHLMSKKYLYPIGWHEIDQLFDPIHMHENMDFPGSSKSPLKFVPAIMPVTAGNIIIKT